MMHDTDFHMIQELQSKYVPAQKNVVNDAETQLIRSVLKIEDRTDVELQNVRDMSVMVYGQRSKQLMDSGDAGEAMTVMDAMSAIAAVIDQEKCRRGLPV